MWGLETLSAFRKPDIHKSLKIKPRAMNRKPKPEPLRNVRAFIIRIESWGFLIVVVV